MNNFNEAEEYGEKVYDEPISPGPGFTSSVADGDTSIAQAHELGLSTVSEGDPEITYSFMQKDAYAQDTKTWSGPNSWPDNYDDRQSVFGVSALSINTATASRGLSFPSLQRGNDGVSLALEAILEVLLQYSSTICDFMKENEMVENQSLDYNREEQHEGHTPLLKWRNLDSLFDGGDPRRTKAVDSKDEEYSSVNSLLLAKEKLELLKMQLQDGSSGVPFAEKKAAMLTSNEEMAIFIDSPNLLGVTSVVDLREKF